MSDRIATILEKLIDRIIRERNEVIAENEKLRDEIERLQAERRWIPVSERLPEFYELVIVLCEDGYRTTCQRTVFWDVSRHHFPFSDVTHWQPLPPPPDAS